MCQERTKHIDMKFHNMRELLALEYIIYEKNHTSDNADNYIDQVSHNRQWCDVFLNFYTL